MKYNILLFLNNYLPEGFFKLFCKFFTISSSNIILFLKKSDENIFANNKIIRHCNLERDIQERLFFSFEQNYLIEHLTSNKQFDHALVVENISDKMYAGVSNELNIELFRLNLLINNLNNPQLITKIYEICEMSSKKLKNRGFNITTPTVMIYKEIILNKHTPYPILMNLINKPEVNESKLHDIIIKHPNYNIAKVILKEMNSL